MFHPIHGIIQLNRREALSHFPSEERLTYMNAGREAVATTTMLFNDTDFSALFHCHYPRVAKVIARIVQDPGRAEELAAEVFWRFWRHPGAHNGNPGGWLYRTAVHLGLDELRRQSRRRRFEQWFEHKPANPSPEQLFAAGQKQQQVRNVLSSLKQRDSELLILRSDGFSYDEIAEILQVSVTSVGTLLRRAQQAFRKEYMKRYEK
jgi:RNA polymerase sigma-70 factor, ECF subfamily